MGSQTWGLSTQSRRRLGLGMLTTFVAATLASGWLVDDGSDPVDAWVQRVAWGLSVAGLVLLARTRRRTGPPEIPAPALTAAERRTARQRIRGRVPLEGADLDQLRAFADRTGRQGVQGRLLLCGSFTTTIGVFLSGPNRGSLWWLAALVVTLTVVLVRSQRETTRCRAFLEATAAPGSDSHA